MIKRLSFKRAVAAFATALTVQAALPRKTEANLLAIPAVAGCTASVVCAVGTVLIGGILYYTVTWRGGETQYFPVTPDPDRETIEYGDELVWADNEAEARRRCEALANQLTREQRTRHTLKRVVKHNRAKYRCVFEVEQ